ncbi:MAG TPA: peptidase [Myxococcales bacterium]|nr:peptidase [Myxococcales bacterium]
MHGADARGSNKWIVWPLITAVVALTTACDAPSPQRETRVGYIEREWTDPNRAAWNGATDWPISAAIWYPAAADAIEAPFVIGPPGLPFLLRGWVARDAPPARAAKALPLILLSHGTGGSRSDLYWLAERLVQDGYVVAAVTHHGNSIQSDDLTAQGFFLFWERALEMTALLDHVLKDDVFGPRIDRTRIGAAGFSLGGNTMALLAGGRLDIEAYYESCQGPEADAADCEPPPESPFTVADLETLIENNARVRASIESANNDWREERIRAVYAIAPAVLAALSQSGAAQIEIPLRIAVGDKDTMAPLATNAQPFSESAPEAELWILSGVDHYTFLGPCGWAGKLVLGEICAESPQLPRNQTLERVAADASAFFGRTLR